MTRSIFSSNRRKRKKAVHTRVWLDGVEVTRSCQIADDRAGRVLLLKLNENSFHYVEAHGGVAKEWRHGSVRMARR